MNETRKPALTGGCQCGAIRYALYTVPGDPSICHCRMCQKAFGNYFAPFAGVPLGDLAWTRGVPALYRSSELVERGFCRDCGTPLTFRYVHRPQISVSLGSLDEPARLPPKHQYGMESRIPWLEEIHRQPGSRTDEDISPEEMPRLASRQHPDHD